MSSDETTPGRGRYRGIVLCVLALAGCDGVGRCRALLEQQRPGEALVACQRAWDRTHDPRAGGAVAGAQAALGGEPRLVEPWAARLAGTPQHGEALLALGRARRRAGQHAEARAALEEAVARARGAGDHGRAMAAAYELFTDAVRETRYLDALAAMDTAELERAAGGLEPMRPTLLASLFDILYEVGDIESARRVLRQASALTDQNDPDQMRYLRARQALVHHADGAWALERQANLETLALERQARVPVPDLTWSTLLNLLELAVGRGDLGEARHYLREAEDFRRARGQPGRGEIALLHRRALVARAAGERDEARRLVAAAQALHPTDQVAWQLATDEGELAEEAAEPARAERAYEAAIAILDRMSRGLHGSELQQWSLARRRRPFARLFALHVAHGQAVRALGVWDRFQRRAFARAPLGAPPAADAGTEPGRARGRLAMLSRLLPALDASPVGADPPPGGAVLPLDLSGLFYFQGMDELFVLVVGEGRVRAHRIESALPPLDRLIARVVARPDDREAAARLGALLVPELPPLGSDAVIHVAPSASLAEVPFAALVVQGQPLVARAALTFLPNLGVLARPEAAADGPPLVLADPLGDLPEARAEATETAAWLGGGEALLGPRATMEALVRGRRAGLIHFATHSGFGSSGPWIQLADQRLLGADLFRLGLHPRTVVLPTCSSAIGSAPGVSSSLAESFLAAGAGAVVGALRSAEDATARLFVRDFYAAGGAADPVHALAGVQRRWARDRPAAQWASFVVLGASSPRAYGAQPPVTIGRGRRLRTVRERRDR